MEMVKDDLLVLLVDLLLLTHYDVVLVLDSRWHARVCTLGRKWGPRIIFLLECQGWAMFAVKTPAATFLIPLRLLV